MTPLIEHMYRVADMWTDIIEFGAIFCIHGAPETEDRGLVSTRAQYAPTRGTRGTKTL